VHVNGADALAVYEAARESVARARRGEGPTLFEVDVQRFTPHSSDDDDRFYRSAEEVRAYREHDPLKVTADRMRELGALDDESEQVIAARVKASVNDATQFAEAAPLPDPSEAFRHVYFEGTENGE
jgi:2-oxoisovalerate dehydrogenase E1 component alpha subunit